MRTTGESCEGYLLQGWMKVKYTGNSFGLFLSRSEETVEAAKVATKLFL